MRRVSNRDMGYRLVRLVSPLNAGRGIQLGVGVRSNEGIEQRVDGQRLGRVAQRGQEMRVEVWRQMKQVGRFLQFRVENRVMMAANVVGDMAV